MGRPAKAWWCGRTRAYFARLGEQSPTTGKRKAVVLRDASGAKVERDDQVGKLAALARLVGQIEAAGRTATGPTVAELCTAYLAWQADSGAAQSTLDTHHYQLSRFARFVAGGVRYADRPASAIGPVDLWALEDAGGGSIRHLFASVLACWRWAARPVRGREPARMIAEYPFVLLERPAAGGRGAEAVLPWGLTRRLLRFARARARTLPTKYRRDRTRAAERLRVLCLHVIAATGCRPAEAWGLEWSEVRWEDRLLAIGGARDKARRKGRAPRKPRRVAVPRRLLDALRRVQGWEQAHPRWVFVPAWTRAVGAPRSKELIRWFRELRTEAIAAGLPIPREATMYWLRHDYQSVGLEVESAEGVAACAGNSPAVLMATYEHTRNRRIVEVADRIAARRRAGGG